MKPVADVISKLIRRKVGHVRIGFYQNSIDFEKDYSHGLMHLTVEFEFKGKPLKNFIFGSLVLNRIENTNNCFGVLLYGEETKMVVQAMHDCFNLEKKTQ